MRQPVVGDARVAKIERSQRRQVGQRREAVVGHGRSPQFQDLQLLHIFAGLESSIARVGTGQIDAPEVWQFG